MQKQFVFKIENLVIKMIRIYKAKNIDKINFRFYIIIKI